MLKNRMLKEDSDLSEGHKVVLFSVCCGVVCRGGEIFYCV